MDNKLSELSNNARKAVNSFYNWSQLASCTSERVSCLTVEQLKETSELLSALLAELEKAQCANNSAPVILRQLAEEKQKRGEVAAATAFNYAASALQKELSK